MNRSRARQSYGDRDGAIADLDEVIALVPCSGRPTSIAARSGC